MVISLDAIARLDAAAREADGFGALGEAVWRDLDNPGPDSAGFLADGTAYVHVARSDTFSPQHWVSGLVVHPDARTQPVDELARLWRDAFAHVASRGGGRLVLWRFGQQLRDDAELVPLGFRPSRELYEMRVALPLRETPTWPIGIDVRPFEPGRDEADWLVVNNRAFTNHDEQGGWIDTTLRRRMAEPWFDPSIFVLAHDAEGLVGFNWGKIHQGHGRDLAIGEIFVIGVDPRAAGQGIGRALAIEGLARMQARGVTTGMLFTDAANTRALSLYRNLGFEVHRIDRAFELDIEAA